ncbi:MAG TPA: hypothetical protein EYH54_00905 [Nautiliaceae bacterium]|nr:hypothetical protein [Nautiliaceae bacterium]
MIDKLVSYFLFFLFLFFILFNIKDLLLKKEEKLISKSLQIKSENFLIERIGIYECYEVLKKNNFDLIKYKDNFNPKINGYTLLTENLLCYFEHDNKFKTRINYSFKY